jgi:hypothetical protein
MPIMANAFKVSLESVRLRHRDDDLGGAFKVKFRHPGPYSLEFGKTDSVVLRCQPGGSRKPGI